MDDCAKKVGVDHGPQHGLFVGVVAGADDVGEAEER